MIEILPESAENVLFCKASQKLTTTDYRGIFVPKLNELIELHGKVKVLIEFSDYFNGFELGAMWEDAKFGIKHRNDFARIAIVSAPNWVEWGVSLVELFMDGQVRTFDQDQLNEAREWIRNNVDISTVEPMSVGDAK